MNSVTHVIRSDGFAGVERYVCAVSNELVGRGWSVTVVGGSPPRMRMHLASSVRFLPASTTPAVMRALLRRPPPELVHAHMTAAEMAAVATQAVHRAPVVTTRHFAGARGSKRLVRLATGLLARRLAEEIAISEFVAERTRRSATVLLSGVPARSTPTGPRSPVVLVMQRLEPEKDTATALYAWRDSGLPSRGWRMKIAGSGSQMQALRELADRLGVADSVDFSGFIADAGSALDSASIFLATTPVEGFGLSVVEAMAAHLPVVAANAGAHPETVGDAGILFRPNDITACAAALRRLADEPELRETLGEAAATRHRERLSIEKHVDGLVKIYARVRGGCQPCIASPQ